MAATFTKIATLSGTGSSGIVTFSSISSSYKDLYFVVSSRAGNDVDQGLQVNGNNINTGKNLYGTGSGTGSQTSGAASGIWVSNYTATTSSTYGVATFYFPNYTSSNYKTVSIESVNENNGTAAYQSMTGAIWNDTNAITSVTFKTSDTTTRFFDANSTFTLYGIKNS
jgi:hypothetical protein